MPTPTPLELTDSQRVSLYARTLENQRTGVVIFEPLYDAQDQLQDLIWRYVSARAASDSHLTVDQMLGQRLLSLFPGTQHTRLWTRYQQVLQTGAAQECQEHYVGEGLDNHLLIRIEPYGGGYLSVSYTLINELRRAQQQAQATAQQLRQVIDGSISGMLACEAVRDAGGAIVDLRVVMANPAAARINGRAVDSLQGRTLGDLFPGLAASGLLARYLHTARTGEVQRLETPYYYDQIEGWFDIASSPLAEQGVLLSFTDITALRQLQAQQAEAIAALQQSNDNLQSFAYVASHDLQEPLRKVESFGSLLQERCGALLDEQGQDYLRRMQGAARRLSGLIRDLLAYSRLGSGQRSPTSVSLGEVVERVLSDLAVSIERSGAVIRVGELPTVAGDALQLGQLMQNLLANAIRYRRPQVPLLIEVASRRVGADRLPPAVGSLRGPVGRPPQYWEISVADNGIGFAETYLDRIFGVFQRLHGQGQYEGTGIGLSICKRVVENHHGAITARSQPGQGATFLVYLPA